MTRVAPTVAAMLGVLLLAAGWRSGAFAGAYLAAVTGWGTLPLGALALLAANQLLGGKWGSMTGRTLVPLVRTVPLTGLLLLPLLLYPAAAWPWARPGWEAVGPGKAAWLDPAAFAGRSLAYVVLWSLLGRWLAGGRSALSPRPHRQPGAIVTLTMLLPLASLAGVDWILSLDPAFNSSIFGLTALSRQLAAALALAIVVGLRSGDTAGRTGALGGLLLAAAIAWGYFAAMQYLVVWTADLPREAAWYLRRSGDGWRIVGWGVIVLHGVVPVLGLAIAAVRRHSTRLAAVAAMVLAGSLLESAWLVVPEFPGTGPLQLTLAYGGVGLVWLAAFALFRAAMPPRPHA